MTRPIVVVGYPKSGNTWLARLVAELVGCPVAGFWGSGHEELAVEGEDRRSEWRVYKAHHRHDELFAAGEDRAPRAVYIVRDPRDVAISAAHYFRFPRWPRVAAALRRFPRGDGLYRRGISPWLEPERYRIDRMLRTIVHGDGSVHPWLDRPWRDHYRPYREGDAAFIRYEDLLSDPARECRRVLEFLGLERSGEHIRAAVENQSFDRKKETLLAAGEASRAAFLRAGRAAQWRTRLSPAQKRYALEHLRPALEELGYPTGDIPSS